MTGYITDKKNSVSSYQPSQAVSDFTKRVQEEFSIGKEIIETSWPELNNYSVIERDNKDKRTFNAFVDEEVEDPAEAWKWRGTRSQARNKGIAMHAQLTASYLIPLFVAQNENDEVDVEFSNYMRDIVEWMSSPNVSDYQSSFMAVSMGMMTNTATFMGAEYQEVMQTIRKKTEEGYEKTDILDEVLSGYHAPVYSSNQILITNAYERNIQKQRCILKRRYVNYSEAMARWEEHENWQYVNRGIRSIYSAEDSVFYDNKDTENPDLIEEVTYLSRRDDTEVCFLNGIYFGEEDVEANPILHRDNRDTPKYNAIPFGYNRIGEHFFYYKSLMNSLGWDNALYDAMSEMVMNRAMLEINMPVAISGQDKFDTDVIFPGGVTAFADKDTKVTPLLPPANMYNAFQALSETDKSITDGSVSDVTSGQLPQASQKAFSVNQAAQNAKKMIGAVGKSLAESLIHYGSLMSNIVVNYYSVPQVEEITGKMKYRKFLLDNKEIGGKKVSKRISFDSSLVGAEATKETKDMMNLEALEQTDYPNNKEHLYRINPSIFAKMKYLTKIDVEEMFPKNDEFKQAMLQQLYTLLRQDPLVNAETLVRKLLSSFFRGESDDLVAKAPIPMTEGPAGFTTPQSQYATQFQNKQLSKMLGGGGNG